MSADCRRPSPLPCPIYLRGGNISFHGPALLAPRECSLPGDHRRRRRSGLWRGLGYLDDLLVAVYHLRRGNTVEIAGLYWHFVDIAWVFLFPLLYLEGHR